MSARTARRRLTQRQKDLLALLLILLVSASLRLWQLDRVPPGLFGDEAVNGLDALDAIAGRARVFYPANFGREGLHILLLTPFINALGPTPLALRLPSAIAGILTAVATYWLGREMLTRTRYSGTLAPLVAALLLSVSYWHVHFSRFGIRGVFTPLAAALAFAAFWHGENRIARVSGLGGSPFRDGPIWGWLILSGVFLGAGVHFYTASRLVPLFVVAFLVVQPLMVWLVARLRADGAEISHPPLVSRAFWPHVAMGVAAIVVFTPLGAYFLQNPGSFAQRASAVSLLNAEVAGTSPLERLADAAGANVAQFFLPGAGDRAQFYNDPGRPVFGLLTGVLALAGIAVCVWMGARGSSPGLFLLLWFPMMLLPAFLAVDRFPTLPRALGVLPGVYFFPALAIAALSQILARRWPFPDRHQWQSLAAAGVVTGVLVLADGIATSEDYFVRWSRSDATQDAFDADILAAVRWLSEKPGQDLFLSADIYRHPSYAFLHAQTPLTEFYTRLDPGVHLFDGRTTLPLPEPGGSGRYLFTNNSGPSPGLARAPGWLGFSDTQVVKDAGAPPLLLASIDAVEDGASAGLYLNAFAAVELAYLPGLTLRGYAVAGGDGVQRVSLLWELGDPVSGGSESLQLQVGMAHAGSTAQITQASSEFAYRATEWSPGSRALWWAELDSPIGLPPDSVLAVRLINQATGSPIAPRGADAEGWLYLPLPR